MTRLAPHKIFTLLESGPVVLVTTSYKGRHNVMTASWTAVLDFTPRFALVTGPWNHSYNALVKTKECVIAIPAVDLSTTAARVGTCSGTELDKFEKFKLTALPASSVSAPLIKECYANIECRVADHIKKHNIFVLDAEAAWINKSPREKRTFHAVGDGSFITDGPRFSLRAVMRSKLPAGL